MALILLVAGGYAWIRFPSWVVRKAETIRCEPLGEAPEFAGDKCPMCDGAVAPGHDCASLAKAVLTPDCPSIVAGSAIDASQWAGIVQQLPELAEINPEQLSAFYLIPEQP